VTHPDPARNGHGTAVVEFSNDLMRKVAYSLLPYAARRPVHEAVARYREDAAGDLLVHMSSSDTHIFHSGGGGGGGGSMHTLAQLDPELLSTLAYHWGRAGHNRRALRYIELAGERAMVGGKTGTYL
jgi:hypothetical protein